MLSNAVRVDRTNINRIEPMSLILATQRLIKYSQDLAAENSLLKQSSEFNLGQIADLKQQLANALSNDASDAETIKLAQADADAAKAEAIQAQEKTALAAAKIVELEDKIDELKSQIEAAELINSHLDGNSSVNSGAVESDSVIEMIETAMPLEILG
jgi:uncharacterized membrane protein YccC